jgi:hypothetical protein
MLLAVGKDSKTLTIDEAVINFATSWADFVLNSYRRLVLEELTFSLDDRKLKKVSDVIKANSPINYRDVISCTRFKPKELAEIIATLRAMGRVSELKGPKGGRLFNWIGSNKNAG